MYKAVLGNLIKQKSYHYCMKMAYIRALLVVIAVMVLFPSLAGQFFDYMRMLVAFIFKS